MNNFDEHCNELVKRWLHYPDQVKTEKQEKRDYALAMERRKKAEEKATIWKRRIWLNSELRFISENEMTEQQKEKEQSLWENLINNSI